MPVLEFAAKELAPKRQELVEALLQNPALPDEVVFGIIISSSVGPADQAPTGTPTQAEPPTGQPVAEGELADERRETLIQRINRMTAAEKIKAALTGSQEERLALIRDSNKIVARAVLQSPKLSDMEVEHFAAMKNVTEEVLRLIATNRKFVKSYAVVRQLINNPRTPIDLGLPLLNRLNERDLKGLTLNKNVAEVLRTMAIKMIKQKEEASKPKLPGGGKH